MKIRLSALVAVTLAATPYAFAQSGPELSVGYSHVETDAGDLGAATVRGTYFFSRYLGAEVEGSLGVKDESNSPLFGGTTKLDHSLAAFGVVRAPITDRLELFGRMGYQTSEISADVPGGVNNSLDVDGLAYGVGGKLFLNERLGLRLDASRFEGGDYEADVFSIGGVIRF